MAAPCALTRHHGCCCLQVMAWIGAQTAAVAGSLGARGCAVSLPPRCAGRARSWPLPRWQPIACGACIGAVNALALTCTSDSSCVHLCCCDHCCSPTQNLRDDFTLVMKHGGADTQGLGSIALRQRSQPLETSRTNIFLTLVVLRCFPALLPQGLFLSVKALSQVQRFSTLLQTGAGKIAHKFGVFNLTTSTHNGGRALA